VNYLMRLGELSMFVKVAWLVWLTWGVAQIEWRRRGRIERHIPAWLPPPAPVPIARVRLLQSPPVPVSSFVAPATNGVATSHMPVQVSSV
jgi:hypothetical protein